MKMIYNGTPVKSLNVHHFEMDTNSATVQPSDLQAGVTCFAKGKKVTGTGKCFEFASYGGLRANESWLVPTDINVIQVSCVDYPIQSLIDVVSTNHLNFSTEQAIGNLIVNNVNYPIKVSVENHILIIACDIETEFQVFYGKDNYTV